MSFNTESMQKGSSGSRPITSRHIFTSKSTLMDSWGLCSFTTDNLDFISKYDEFQKIINKDTTGKEQYVQTYKSILDTNQEEYINETQNEFHTVNVNMSYKAPAKLNDTLEIYSAIKRIGNSSITFTQEIYKKDCYFYNETLWSHNVS